MMEETRFTVEMEYAIEKVTGERKMFASNAVIDVTKFVNNVHWYLRFPRDNKGAIWSLRHGKRYKADEYETSDDLTSIAAAAAMRDIFGYDVYMTPNRPLNTVDFFYPKTETGKKRWDSAIFYIYNKLRAYGIRYETAHDLLLTVEARNLFEANHEKELARAAETKRKEQERTAAKTPATEKKEDPDQYKEEVKPEEPKAEEKVDPAEKEFPKEEEGAEKVAAPIVEVKKPEETKKQEPKQEVKKPEVKKEQHAAPVTEQKKEQNQKPNNNGAKQESKIKEFPKSPQQPQTGSDKPDSSKKESSEPVKKEEGGKGETAAKKPDAKPVEKKLKVEKKATYTVGDILKTAIHIVDNEGKVIPETPKEVPTPPNPEAAKVNLEMLTRNNTEYCAAIPQLNWIRNLAMSDNMAMAFNLFQLPIGPIISIEVFDIKKDYERLNTVFLDPNLVYRDGFNVISTEDPNGDLLKEVVCPMRDGFEKIILAMLRGTLSKQQRKNLLKMRPMCTYKVFSKIDFSGLRSREAFDTKEWTLLVENLGPIAEKLQYRSRIIDYVSPDNFKIVCDNEVRPIAFGQANEKLMKPAAEEGAWGDYNPSKYGEDVKMMTGHILANGTWDAGEPAKAIAEDDKE